MSEKIKHLDEPIIDLAINFERLSFVKNPGYSCSGHLAKRGVIKGIAPEAKLWCKAGYWPFSIDMTDSRSEKFLNKLNDLTNRFEPVSLKDNEADNSFHISIQFNQCKGFQFKESLVDENAGIIFYKEYFIGFWEAFNDLVKSSLSLEEENLQIEACMKHVKVGATISIEKAVLEA